MEDQVNVTDIKAAIGQRIRAARRDLGLNQSELAERVGVTPSTVSMWETGTVAITAVQLHLLSEILVRPFGYFSLTGVEAPSAEALDTSELANILARRLKQRGGDDRPPVADQGRKLRRRYFKRTNGRALTSLAASA